MNDRPHEYVKVARARLDMTQEELALALGMERHSIVRYEKHGAVLPDHVRRGIEKLLRERKQR